MDDEYLEAARREIILWESQGPGFLIHLGDFLLLPAENAARALIPAGLQDAVAKAIENVLFGLSSAALLIGSDEKIYHKVEVAYRESGDRLKAADAVAKGYWRRNVAYGLGEGGVTGAVGLPGLVADVPALFTISLRLIQQVGACYGYDMRSDVEREYLMHVVHVGSSSNLRAKMECLIGLKQLEQILLKVSSQKISQALARGEISRLSLLAALDLLARRLGIQLTKRKALQLVPVVGALIGASFNALFVNDIGRAAYMLYRGRRIAELQGPGTTVLDVKAVVPPALEG